MKLFFRFVFFYLVIAIPSVAILRGEGIDMLLRAMVATYAFATVMVHVLIYIVPLFVVIPLLMGWRRFVANLGPLGYAFAASILLQTGFSLVKPTIPVVIPFYADTALAGFDNWLHGGVDPWILTHRIGEWLPMESILPIYMTGWLVPAIGMAVILAIADNDPERQARFLTLYLVCWILIGNILAFVGSSVGPVYYDALLNSDRFVALTVALKESGVTASSIGYVQQKLWEAYAVKGNALGIGISAFPSVHVAVAAVVALYLMERSRWLVIPGVAFLATIFFLSVYTGYHYAVDGYVSMIVIVACWAVLRRVQLTALNFPWTRSPISAEPVVAGRG